MHPRAAFLQQQIYPLHDRVLQCIRGQNLPFYLTGSSALHRFILSGRYTNDLEYCLGSDPLFADYAEQAAKAIMAEFADSSVHVHCTHASETTQIIRVQVSTEHHFDISFRSGSVFHVDGAMAGGFFFRPACGKLDYWLNILADIVARETCRGIDDVADLWWMAINYSWHWPEVQTFALRKNHDCRLSVTAANLSEASITSLAEIPWIIDKDPAIIQAQLGTMADDMIHGLHNSLAPDPVIEH